MKYQFVTLGEDSKLTYSQCEYDEINSFCLEKRNVRNSQCNSHYKQLFDSYMTGERALCKCPYGLFSIGPIKWTERPKVATGIVIEDEKYPEGLSNGVVSNTKKQVEEYLFDFDQIAKEISHQNYQYLESAIHDVRHLNADITAHAESLLKGLGYAENADWDKEKLYSNETDKRTLSIYCASRDLSAALSIHEMVIDPNRVNDDVVPTSIHKQFYRQKQVNFEKLKKKNLDIQLDNTSVSKNLTRSFALVPIILINNAIKYAENNSVINVRFIQAGSNFRIVCSNRGPIVRNDELDAVFQKGRRGSNKSGISGHGIGLWLASTILHANCGTISMEIVEEGRDYAGRKRGLTSVIVRLA